LPKRSSEARVLALSGTEMALLLASLFILANCSFKMDAARRLVRREARAAAHALDETLFTLWRDSLAAVGLWTSPWGASTEEFILQRSRVKLEVGLVPEQQRVAALAARATVDEFERSWRELCVAAPGALHWYPAGIEDLRALAIRLEQGLPPLDSELA